MRLLKSYVLGLDNLGHTLINEIKMFSQSIGQSTDDTTTMAIYRELMYQVVAAYSTTYDMIGLSIASLPVWTPILYVEDSDRFFDIKREFAGRVRLLAMGIHGFIHENVPEHNQPNRTFMMQSVTPTLIILDMYDTLNVNSDLI